MADRDIREIEVAVEFVRQTAVAVQVSDGIVMPWLPKSLITNKDELDLDASEKGDTMDIEIPEWLAKDKGLI